MLVTLNDVLKDAQEKHYAVGLFNTMNYEMTRAVLETAEQCNSPVIIGTAESLLEHCSLEDAAAMMRSMAERCRVPVVLHYDHGMTWNKVTEALNLGFSSVMYDCSRLPYEENVEQCRRMTDIAHAFGASIEAELGHVGTGAPEKQDQSIYTDAEDARRFAEATGVDALAVAIGTAHGVYHETPRLDIGRLDEIRSVVETPLVLHGGSGLSDQDFRNCVEHGIAKINIFTDLNQAGCRGAAKASAAGGSSLFEVLPAMRQEIKETVLRKMELFGSVNRA